LKNCRKRWRAKMSLLEGVPVPWARTAAEAGADAKPMTAPRRLEIRQA
jgi:hypothetical protein